MVLAVGAVLERLKAKGLMLKSPRQDGDPYIQHPTSNIQQRTLKWGAQRLRSKVQSLKSNAQLALLLVVAGAMGFGLLKSYSRGAWVGTSVGLAMLVRLKAGALGEGVRKRGESPSSLEAKLPEFGTKVMNGKV